MSERLSIAPDESEMDWGPTSSEAMSDFIYAWCERNWDRCRIGLALKELQARYDEAGFIQRRAERMRDMGR